MLEDLLSTTPGVFSWQSTLISLLLAYLLGQWVAGLYAWTYRGLSYSRGMVQALVLAAIIAAIVMLVIGNNLIRGIGLIGTLALVRFRTNLRDPWDMIFVFAVFALGIAAGTQNFELALLGALVFSGAVLVMTKSGFGSRQQYDGLLRLSLPAALESQQELQQVLHDRCRSFILVTLREVEQGARQEHAYQVRLRRPEDQVQLVSDVSDLAGARVVVLHMQEATVEL